MEGAHFKQTLYEKKKSIPYPIPGTGDGIVRTIWTLCLTFIEALKVLKLLCRELFLYIFIFVSLMKNAIDPGVSLSYFNVSTNVRCVTCALESSAGSWRLHISRGLYPPPPLHLPLLVQTSSVTHPIPVWYQRLLPHSFVECPPFMLFFHLPPS